MPINKNNQTMWQGSEDEIQKYDDQMVADIRLKTDENFDDPSYSLLASRQRKEKFFEYNDKALQSL